MIHEFASVFSTNLLYVGLPRKAFPGKQAKVDTTLRLHTSVFLWLHKQEPRFAQGQPNGYFHMSHAINPPSCGKKGGGHKNVCVSKTLRCVSQRKLARKQNIGISTRKLAL